MLIWINGEEVDYGFKFDMVGSYFVNFIKGFLYNEYGIVMFLEDYWCFVEVINLFDLIFFEKGVEIVDMYCNELFCCKVEDLCDKEKFFVVL